MSASSNTADALWQKVVQDYRQLCVLQQQARNEESLRLLQNDLPVSILEWSERDSADGASKARRLDEMFQVEQTRLADAWLAQELMAQQVRAELLPSLTAQITAEVRKAVTESNLRPAATLAPAARPQAPAPTRAPQPAPSRPAPAAAPAARPARVAAGDLTSIIDLILADEQSAPVRPLAA